MQRHAPIAIALLLAPSLVLGACTSREDRMREKMAIDTSTPEKEHNPADDIPEVPADPTRDALAPLLTEIYASERLPDVRETQEPVGEAGYAITNPGVLAIIELEPGLSEGDKAKAIVRGVAEADGFAVRNDAERYFPEQLLKIKNSFGDEERDLVRSVYGDLRLLDFFASDKAEGIIAKLDGPLKTAVTELKDEYLGKKDEI